MTSLTSMVKAVNSKVSSTLSTVGRPFYTLLLSLLLILLYASAVVIKIFKYKHSLNYQILKIKLLKETVKPHLIEPANRQPQPNSLWFSRQNLKSLFNASLHSRSHFPRFSQIPNKPKQKTYTYRLIKYLIVLFVCFVIFLVLGSFSLWYIYLKDLPSPLLLQNREQSVSTKIYDRNGKLLYKIYDDKNRTPIKLKDVPIMVRQATLAAEDAEFYQHPGFSIKGILRAVRHNYQKDGELTGGSTITQQLVKNTLLTSEKTYVRKLREIVLAFGVEWYFNKNEILEMYLNEVSYGGTTYGIQEASIHYFGKDVADLTLGEAALLAGLPKSPTKLSPFGNHPEYAFSRQKDILRLMKINGFITSKEMDKALNEFINFAPNITNIKAPHFVIYTKQILEKEYGQDLVGKRGLEVTTTLDLNIQHMAEDIVRQEIEKLAGFNVTNGAVVVMDPKTGEIIAMVGSSDYFSENIDGKVNLTTTKRQPGSSIKIVNYAYALSHGFTVASIVEDTPITFTVPNQQPYTPKNYDNSFSGNMTVRNAFAQSRNIPAVKILNSYGVENMLNLGKAMGISTWDDPRGYGLSLTLGGGEVKLIDLARVYASVANEGKLANLSSILHIKDYENNVLYTSMCTRDKLDSNEYQKNCEHEVLDKRVAFIITDILKDNRARAAAFGTHSQLVIPNHSEVAVKTGTSDDLKDNLTVGYTKDYVVAVWVGNNDNSPMSKIASGLTGASTVFNKVMTALLEKKDSYNDDPPDGIEKLAICPYTGTLSCNGCPVYYDYFLSENKPAKACDPSWFTPSDLDAETVTEM
ncbi:penicillin-binding protein [Candidatus Woesebacteria bacterium]|nr:MAG: penicillin-binding protein [Candidatus Woesebacteria bacterium]